MLILRVVISSSMNDKAAHHVYRSDAEIALWLAWILYISVAMWVLRGGALGASKHICWKSYWRKGY